MRELSHTQPLPEVDIARLRPALRARARRIQPIIRQPQHRSDETTEREPEPKQ